MFSAREACIAASYKLGHMMMALLYSIGAVSGSVLKALLYLAYLVYCLNEQHALSWRSRYHNGLYVLFWPNPSGSHRICKCSQDLSMNGPIFEQPVYTRGWIVAMSTSEGDTYHTNARTHACIPPAQQAQENLVITCAQLKLAALL